MGLGDWVGTLSCLCVGFVCFAVAVFVTVLRLCVPRCIVAIPGPFFPVTFLIFVLVLYMGNPTFVPVCDRSYFLGVKAGQPISIDPDPDLVIVQQINPGADLDPDPDPDPDADADPDPGPNPDPGKSVTSRFFEKRIYHALVVLPLSRSEIEGLHEGVQFRSQFRSQSIPIPIPISVPIPILVPCFPSLFRFAYE